MRARFPILIGKFVDFCVLNIQSKNRYITPVEYRSAPKCEDGTDGNISVINSM